MPKMIVTQEVEATPELVKVQLDAFTAQTRDYQFPHPRGTFQILKPQYIKGMNAVEGMPVKVVTAPKGTLLAMVAFVRADVGKVQITFISEDTIESVWNPDTSGS